MFEKINFPQVKFIEKICPKLNQKEFFYNYFLNTYKDSFDVISKNININLKELTYELDVNYPNIIDVIDGVKYSIYNNGCNDLLIKMVKSEISDLGSKLLTAILANLSKEDISFYESMMNQEAYNFLLDESSKDYFNGNLFFKKLSSFKVDCFGLKLLSSSNLNREQKRGNFNYSDVDFRIKMIDLPKKYAEKSFKAKLGCVINRWIYQSGKVFSGLVSIIKKDIAKNIYSELFLKNLTTKDMEYVNKIKRLSIKLMFSSSKLIELFNNSKDKDLLMEILSDNNFFGHLLLDQQINKKNKVIDKMAVSKFNTLANIFAHQTNNQDGKWRIQKGSNNNIYFSGKILFKALKILSNKPILKLGNNIHWNIYDTLIIALGLPENINPFKNRKVFNNCLRVIKFALPVAAQFKSVDEYIKFKNSLLAMACKKTVFYSQIIDSQEIDDEFNYDYFTKNKAFVLKRLFNPEENRFYNLVDKFFKHLPNIVVVNPGENFSPDDPLTIIEKVQDKSIYFLLFNDSHTESKPRMKNLQNLGLIGFATYPKLLGELRVYLNELL